MSEQAIDINTLNIYQRINEVRKEVEYIQKNKQVSTGAGSGYKAVTHDEVTGIIRKKLVEFGIICVPTLVESEVSPTTTKDGQPSNVIRYEAIYDFAFVNADKPDEFVTVRMGAHANDNQDKAPGKAISYAKKYAVLKLFEIETGEDEESRFAEPEHFPLEKYLDMLDKQETLDDLDSVYELARQAAIQYAAAPEFKVIKSKVATRRAALGGKQ